MSQQLHGTTPPSRTSTSAPVMPVWVLPAVVFGAVVVIGTSVAGAFSGLLSGHGWAWPGGPGPMVLAVKSTVLHLGDPAAAWPTEPAPGPGWLFWTCAALVLAAAAAAVWWGYSKILERRMRRRAVEQGFAGASELRRRNLTAERAVSRAVATRTPLQDTPRKDLDPYLVAVNVASEYTSGEQIFLQQRDCVHVVSPTGGGKTWGFAVPRCWDAPGFLLTTSTRADLPAATIADRLDRGHVAVFDPEDITGLPNQLKVRIPLIGGCEEPATAIRRSDALVKAMPMGDTKNASYWQDKAATLLRCYLHAAALSGARMDQVRIWAMSRNPKRPQDILRSDNPSWAEELTQILSSESTSADDMIGAVANLFKPLADPRLLEAIDCPPEQATDLAELVLGSDRSGTAANTLYALSSGEAESTAPIIAAVTNEAYFLCSQFSQWAPGQQMPVPARFNLDEVNNVAPIPHLPRKMTDSGGRGINLWAFSHNESQVRERWGDRQGEQFLKSSPVRIVLPGLGDDRELQSLSRLCGTRTVYDGPNHTPRDIPVMRDSDIRQMPEDQGLMIYRNAKPALIRIPSVWADPDRASYVKASMDIFDRARDTGQWPATGLDR
ncbi:TraM recognition domain-containing protein [Gordonia sp. N1V]|uniref:type IV secretory system conjugative DNA transfer family protein n=1 Tax=Gordonia sp. N1V TaxID=3034163 RepID=UPI0023E157E4|nr:TraM recognition domain-containing protein [Gordonia sp. N1V]MDF3285023.1 TraM recognition domain-containing protein [Gordonia sp. N1V]